MISGAHLHSCDLYGMLRVCPSADAAEIRSAYRHAALAAHPDKGGSKEAFHQVATAFSILYCPSSRALYDRIRRIRSGSAVSVRRCGKNVATARRGLYAKAVKRTQQVREHAKRKAKRKVTTCNGSKLPAQDAALRRLAASLQAMNPQDRRAAIDSVDTGMRLHLISFMKKARGFPADHRPSKTSGRRQGQLLASKSATSVHVPGLRTIKTAACKRYQAHIQFSGLHLRTEAQASFQNALDHQQILFRVRQKVLEESSIDRTFWDDPAKIQRAVLCVLDENGTTEAKLGLRALVRLRASRWLGPRFEFDMPSMSFEEAATCHARFCQAMGDSWDAVRSELIHAAHCHRGWSPEKAESTVDMARRHTLQGQFAQALRSASACISTSQNTGPGLASKMKGA